MQYQLAEYYFQGKNYSLALKEFLKLFYLYPQNQELVATALYRSGECYEAEGNPQEARKTYLKLISRYPESSWVKYAAQKVETLEMSADRKQ